uniref:DUS-like FMN-binding domain-containing protein n=1 Tax=Strigamia maritima TaxID=126957 RepID=T1JM82_STRMM
MPENLNYQNAVILAPMVRIGTLPFRLLALNYGADIVYSEEIVDHKLLKCRRVVNNELDTIDFIDDTEDVVVFRTCSEEKNQVVLQLGTSEAQRALKAVKLVEQDVSGIDINMGCPKEFSLKGGMGAALLYQPEKVKEILSTLVGNVSIPVTCKIRVLPELEDTINLCKLIESTGVAAIAVHGRTKDERPRHSNRNEYIRAITQSLSIPVIANGGSKEIVEYDDIEKFRKVTGSTSVMIARTAQWNCSIFRKEGKLPLDEVIKSLLKYAIDYDNHPLNTKYGVQQMLQDLQETPLGRKLLSAKTLHQICELWQLEDYYLKKQNNAGFVRKKNVNVRIDVNNDENDVKRFKKENFWEVDVKFERHSYKVEELPKTTLLMWTRQKEMSQPKYETIHKDKLFKSMVHVDGIVYTTVNGEKNK